MARPAGSLVAVQPLSDSVHESVAQEGGLGVVGPGAELLEADGSGQVLTKGVPPGGFSFFNCLSKNSPEMVLLQELLHMLGGGATSAGLKKNSTSQQGHDGQHLR